MKDVDEALIAAGHYRVYLIAKIDHRVDKDVHMLDKVKAVEETLERRSGG